MQNFLKNNFIIQELRYLFGWFLDTIYSTKCAACGCAKSKGFLCKTCAGSVSFLSGFAQGKIEGVEIYSAFLYDDILKTLIQNYKFNNRLKIKTLLADFLFEYFNKNFAAEKFVVVPVPSHKKRISKRGYDHINLIAKEFCARANLPLKTNILFKIKDTRAHFNLNKNQRAKNIKGSFLVKNKNYRGENFLIIDDITTTGATLREVVLEFKKAGIKKLTCLTICKTP